MTGRAGDGETRHRGVFFLHIPKTAGSFVARMFEDRLGPAACITFQEREVQHRVSKGGRLSFLGHDFVSAHSPMATLRLAGVPRHYRIFSVLRDPMDRLVSHLNWLDRFNHGIDLHSHAALKQDMKMLVRALDGLDPDSPAEMRRLFRLDSLAKARMLFNMQATMLLSAREGDILRYVDVERLSRAQIRRQLSRLAFCATLEQFTTGLAARGIAPPEDGRINSAKTGRFRRSPALEEAAERYVAVDRKLHDMVAQDRPDLSAVTDRLAAGRPDLRLAASA
ncbi:sulfotransferase family 2 domain-containing protein [Mangrovicoccus algicola]|uniref:Sulfotransferase family 2 domain-containing protein n=1 Tax=Mangrovicoccus algicola TaxID=2771008 RepID=A0A8J6ZD61_9RHOB|nr:sulfotransferase family 2 domain-containing protein [Mangrovicoccus algicola]MBE3639986.1 sulfotransferase family 2 domain-containing protein [Mangrovicoccus algicola]